MKKPCSEMFCLRNQDITDAKAFFYLFFMSNSGYLFIDLSAARMMSLASVKSPFAALTNFCASKGL